jgi:hypothetical protein
MKLIFLLFLSFSLSSALSYCGGNCPNLNCPDCPCGSSPSYADISAWCSLRTWNQTCCQCIVSKESGGNFNAVNFNAYDNSYDAGLFQVNSLNWPYCGMYSWNACDLTLNLNCATMVYAWAGNTWRFWSTAAACNCSNSS